MVINTKNQKKKKNFFCARCPIGSEILQGPSVTLYKVKLLKKFSKIFICSKVIVNKKKIIGVTKNELTIWGR